MEREGGAERPLVHSPHGLSGWSRKPRIRNFILVSHMGAGYRGLSYILLFLQATRRKLDWKVEHQGHDSAPIQDVGNADGFWFCPHTCPCNQFWTQLSSMQSRTQCESKSVMFLHFVFSQNWTESLKHLSMCVKNTTWTNYPNWVYTNCLMLCKEI